MAATLFGRIALAAATLVVNLAIAEGRALGRGMRRQHTQAPRKPPATLVQAAWEVRDACGYTFQLQPGPAGAACAGRLGGARCSWVYCNNTSRGQRTCALPCSCACRQAAASRRPVCLQASVASNVCQRRLEHTCGRRWYCFMWSMQDSHQCCVAVLTNTHQSLFVDIYAHGLLSRRWGVRARR